MARPGDEFVDQNGARLVFRETAGTTDGELLEVLVTYSPHSKLPPLHFHPSQEERFEIKGGIIRAIVDEQESFYREGDVLVIPPGTKHQMQNIADEPGQVVWQTRPAMRTEVFFETVWGLAQDGKSTGRSVSNLLQMIVIGKEYRDEFRAVEPPDFIQRVLFAVVAPVARLAGYRGSYAEYSDKRG